MAASVHVPMLSVVATVNVTGPDGALAVPTPAVSATVIVTVVGVPTNVVVGSPTVVVVARGFTVRVLEDGPLARWISSFGL